MRSSIQVTPNVTPMVDVMLVLLIIFMVVAPTLLDGFVVEPPKADHAADKRNDSTDVTLGIDAAGRYYLNKHLVDSSALVTALRSIYTPDREDRVLYLKADRDLDYARVIAAVDIARNSGVGMIGMVTRPPAGGRR